MKIKAGLIAAFKIWVVIYPSITLLLYFFGKSLNALPLVYRTFLLTVVLVPWVVFAGLPTVNFFSGFIRHKIKNKQP